MNKIIDIETDTGEDYALGVSFVVNDNLDCIAEILY